MINGKQIKVWSGLGSGVIWSLEAEGRRGELRDVCVVGMGVRMGMVAGMLTNNEGLANTCYKVVRYRVWSACAWALSDGATIDDRLAMLGLGFPIF